MARARFAFGRLRQGAQDSAFAGFLAGMTGVAQRMQLPLKQAQRLDLLVDSRNLAIDQLIDFAAR